MNHHAHSALLRTLLRLRSTFLRLSYIMHPLIPLLPVYTMPKHASAGKLRIFLKVPVAVVHATTQKYETIPIKIYIKIHRYVNPNNEADQ